MKDRGFYLKALIAVIFLHSLLLFISANKLIRPLEDQLIYISLRNSLLQNKEIIMPDIKVSKEDLHNKGDSFRAVISKTDLHGQYFRSTVPLGSITAFWEPGFILIITLLSFLSRRIVIIKIFNSIIYITSIFLLMKLSGGYFTNKRLRIFLFCFLSFLPLNIVYNHKIMSETLYLSLIVLIVYLTENFGHFRNKPYIALILGFLSGLIFLVKSQGIFIIFPLFTLKFAKKSRAALSTIMLCFALCISPWLIRNHNVFNTIVIFPTKGAITLWARNNPLFLYKDAINTNSLERLALKNALKNEDLYHFPELKGHDEISREREIKGLLINMIKRDPVNYSIMSLIRASLIFYVPIPGDFGLFVSFFLLIIFLHIIIYNIAHRNLYYMNLFILLSFVFSVFVNSDTRFRLPLDPLILLSLFIFIKQKYFNGLSPRSLYGLKGL